MQFLFDIKWNGIVLTVPISGLVLWIVVYCFTNEIYYPGNVLFN